MWYMWRTGIFLYRVPFSSSGSTWRLQMIDHSSLVTSYSLCHHYGQMLPSQVVCLFGVVVPASCTNTIRHRQRLGSLGNFPYLEGYFLQIITYTWESFGVVLHEEALFLQPLGAVVVFAPHVCPVKFHMRCGCAFCDLGRWYGCFKTSAVGFSRFVSPLL